jgi:chitinase
LDRRLIDQDIDWEYPAGNGEDYKRIPNSKKVDEIKSYPKLLKEIKNAIGDKELSIAVPGLERDMIAYTHEQVPKINAVVDYVNVSTWRMQNMFKAISNCSTDHVL